MNKKTLSFLKNISYTLTSNVITLLVSTLVILIVPKLFGVEEYGYWQLYLFYSTYVGFLHFGWNDGLYLRYGGLHYDDLSKGIFSGQFFMLFLFQGILAVTGFIIVEVFIVDENRLFVLKMLSICLLITNLRHMLLFVFQATNRIKEYARIILLEKILYLFLLGILLSFGVRSFEILIIADLICRGISFILAIYYSKEIVLIKFNKFKIDFKETYLNISVGIKLMFANIAGLLIIGNVRFGIERSWDVITFGKVSLSLSLANFMMVFINAIGIVLFPILKRSNPNNLPHLYITFRKSLSLILLPSLFLYFPIKIFFLSWLPDFKESIIYLAIIFPIFVYEGKMVLLINTYLKVLRQEQKILNINIVTLILSVVITIICTLILHDLNWTVFSIPFLLAFRSIMSEYILTKILSVEYLKEMITENILVAIFILTTWFFTDLLAFLVYLTAFVMYILWSLKTIRKIIFDIKIIVTN